jgi:uncharacterized protein
LRRIILVTKPATELRTRLLAVVRCLSTGALFSENCSLNSGLYSFKSWKVRRLINCVFIRPIHLCLEEVFINVAIVACLMRHVLQGEHCYSWWSQCRGLMFTKTPRTLFFHFRAPSVVRLHMMFVFFPIDVVLLDAAGTVLEIKETLLPWHFYTSTQKAVCAVECEAGTVRHLGLNVSDLVLPE